MTKFTAVRFFNEIMHNDKFTIQYHHMHNVIVKCADDSYLIIPASNQNTCIAEIQHIVGPRQ